MSLLPLSVLILAMTMPACSTHKSTPATLEKTVLPILPPAWLRQCPELASFDSGDIAGILVTHGRNAQTAGICRARHNALVKRLKELQ